MKDQEIISLISDKATKERGFALLLNHYKERVYWQIRHLVLLHEDADDLTQEVFIKIYQNLDSFKQDSQLSTWIYKIALNHSLNFIKAKKRKHLLSLSNYEDTLFNKLKAETYFEPSDIELRLQKAILSLPQKQRVVFSMRYYDEVPFKEMSEILNTNQTTLKTNYHFAVKKIKDMILEEDNINLEEGLNLSAVELSNK